MDKGILLIAFGNRGYGFIAYNLAVSIRAHNKTIPIQLLHDDSAIRQLSKLQLDIFDIKVKVEHDFTNPGQTKIELLKYSQFANTLYIDVDSIALKDIEPLIDELIASESDIATMVYDHDKLTDGDNVQKLNWVYGAEMYAFYQLKNRDILPCINTSLIFYRNNTTSHSIIDDILSKFNFPFEHLKLSWGGTMPDEVPFAAALVNKKNVEMPENAMLFGNKALPEGDSELIDSYYFMSIYGGRNTTKMRYTNIYDRLMAEHYDNLGQDYIYKYHLTVGEKHANKSQQMLVKPMVAPEELPALSQSVIPISESILIASNDLIQIYTGPRGEVVQVTSWLNCSIIEYKGKNILCYRMESKPFGTRIKLGMVELDSQYKPIKDTNTLLELHSDLSGYKKGFHVEDPRLFIHDNSLYLSYTDGYQMAQAKIDSDTLQAVESYYIDKPKQNVTEKNWTFFSHDNDLLSVYTINPHTILKMNGAQWNQMHQVDFDTIWKWGEPRGGTSPIRIGNKYYSFFHSAIDIKHRGYKGRQYFMGMYVFSAVAPFEPIAISKEPIISGEYIDDQIPRLSNRIYVVFPNGAIRKRDKWVVSFGYNDHECRLIDITDTFLKENLIPIEYESKNKKEKIQVEIN